MSNWTRNSDVPAGASRRAATSGVEERAIEQRGDCAAPAPARARHPRASPCAGSTGARGPRGRRRRAPSLSDSTTLSLNWRSPRSRSPCSRAGCTARRSRARSPPEPRPRRSRPMSSLLSGSPSGRRPNAMNAIVSLVRDARHETEEPGLAPRARLAGGQAPRRNRIVDDDGLTVVQPGRQARARLDGPAIRSAASHSRRRRMARNGRPRRVFRRQLERDAIDTQRLAHALDQLRAQAPRSRSLFSSRVKPRARGGSRSDRGSTGDPGRTDGVPQRRRHQRDDERREQRPEAAAIRCRRRAREPTSRQRAPRTIMASTAPRPPRPRAGPS